MGFAHAKTNKIFHPPSLTEIWRVTALNVAKSPPFSARQLPTIASGCLALDKSFPKGATMLIPFLIGSILIIMPTMLIAWWGVREDANGR
jgi:hypothetical protein